MSEAKACVELNVGLVSTEINDVHQIVLVSVRSESQVYFGGKLTKVR